MRVETSGYITLRYPALTVRAKRLIKVLADIDVRDALRRREDKAMAVTRDIPVATVLLARREVSSWPETKRKREKKFPRKS